MLINYDRFEQTEYGENSVVKESKIMTTRFSAEEPGLFNLQSDKWELNDETDLVQLGQSTVTDIYDWKLTEWIPSAWKKFPDAENPHAKYKFISLGIQQGKSFT